MMKHRHLRRGIPAASVAAALVSCISVISTITCIGAIPVPESYLELELGQVDFPTSTTNADAAQWFNYGLLQLFSFGYDYSTPAFAQAKEEDPNFALAYAMEALCHYWPLWSYDDADTANVILAEITNSTEMMMDDRESLYIDAIVAHFNTSIISEGERYQTSVDTLQQVHDAYPDDPSAPALLGLWRLHLSSLQTGDTAQTTTAKAIENLNASLTIQPDHPGALHYSLHAFDHIEEDIYTLGLAAAQLYPIIAPGASHGAHMPMHILFRTGNFSACWDADHAALVAADLTCALYGRANDEACDLWNLYHSVEYLQIEGYMTGQWEAATQMYQRMTDNYTSAVANNNSAADSLKLWWMRMAAREILEGQMTAGQLFVLDDDHDVTCPTPQEPLDAGFWTSHTESGYLLGRGLCQVFATDVANNETLLAELEDTKRRLAAIPEEFGGEDPESHDYYSYLVNVIHVRLLDGAHAFVQGNWDDFQAAMINATALEQSLQQYWTANSPTMLFLSAPELYGQLLLLAEDDENNREKALEQFLLADETQGLQLSTMLGKARATEGSDEAAAYYQRAFDMLHPNHDGEALPFWEEVTVSLNSVGTTTAEPASEDDEEEGSQDVASAAAATASSWSVICLLAAMLFY